VPPKPVPFETLHGGSAIRFLGSFYATAQNICDMTKEVGQGSGSERMGGYDQFISLLFCVLQIIYVLHIHLCCFMYSKEFISSVLLSYNMLYLFVLILQSCCLYFYLFSFNCSVSLHVYRIYMTYIIHMLYVLMIHIVMDIFDIMINYLLYVIIIILIYGIKMIRKIPIILTRATRHARPPHGAAAAQPALQQPVGPAPRRPPAPARARGPPPPPQRLLRRSRPGSRGSPRFRRSTSPPTASATTSPMRSPASPV
jgi:hypothetical protein